MAQIHALAGACVLLALAIVAGRRSWIPPGAASILFYGTSGIGMALLLRYANLPPHWFDGDWGVILAIGILAWATAFSSRTFTLRGPESERLFRLPFLFGFGSTLLIVNVLVSL